MYDFRNILPLFYDFYIVIQEGNITKAAKNHYVSQPSLTRSIQNLENQLNLKLINRNNKGITLTLDGEKLYKKLDELFIKFNDNLILDNSSLIGNLTIGTTRNIADNKLSDILTKFYNKYPMVRINIIIDSAINLNEYLKTHKIDVLIDYLPHINNNEKLDIEVKAFGKFNTVFACSHDFYCENKDNLNNIEDLSKYNLVIPGKSRRRQLLDEFLQNNNLVLNPIIEMPDSKLMADFIKKNKCIGYFIEEEANDYDLVKLNLSVELPCNSIGLIYSKNTINEITKKFINLVLNTNIN